MAAKLTSLRIQGFRCIEDLTIRLDGLQVFIGENGSGKSTIVESFELLRRLATPGRFAFDFYTRHGDLSELRRSLAIPFRLTARCEEGEKLVEYSAELASSGVGLPSFAKETLSRMGDIGQFYPVFSRTGPDAMWRSASDGPTLGQRLSIDQEQSAMLAPGIQDPSGEIELVRRVFSSLDTFVPIEVGPLWAQPHELGTVRSLRNPTRPEPARRLARDGSNITSVYSTILAKGPDVNRAVLEDVRAGLGLDVSYVSVASPAPGQMQLRLHFGTREVPASQLSQGQLSYLLLVALKHLDHEASAVIWDEPELHLHPRLLTRAAWLFEEIAARRPVLVMTHADAFLDALDKPERFVRVLTLDASRRAVLNGIDADRLVEWRKMYHSLGEIRRDGMLPEILTSVSQ